MDFEASIIKFIQSFHSQALDVFFAFITNFGGQIFYIIAIPALHWNGEKKLGIKISTALVFSIYINIVLKQTISSPRPIDYPGIRSLFTVSGTGYAFPSGHAQGASTFWGILMAHFQRPIIYVLGIAIILLVCLSRLYLGLHWPSDVIFGTLLGLFVAYIFTKIKDIKIRNTNIKIIGSFIIPGLLTALFPHHDVYKYMGMLSGILAGHMLEQLYIKYKAKKSGLTKAVFKYGSGLAGVIIIYFVIKRFLPKQDIFVAIRYSLIGLWFAAGAPLLFKKCKL